MKKIIALSTFVLIVSLLGSLIVNAQDVPSSSTGTSPSNVTNEQTITNVAQNTVANQQQSSQSNISITPDNPFYIFKRLIESLQVTLTFSSEGKAQVLISLANERLGEAKIMTERNKQVLVEKAMQSYLKAINEANNNIAEAAQKSTDIKPAIEELKIAENSGDNFVISITGNVAKETEDQLKASISNELKRTLSAQALSASRAALKDANNKLDEAKKELEDIDSTGDKAAIAAAQQKVQQAEQYKEQMQDAKKQIQQYKNDEKEDSDELSNSTSIANKQANFIKHSEKNKEKAERFKEKASKQYEKFMKKAHKFENKKFSQQWKEDSNYNNEDENDNDDEEGEDD